MELYVCARENDNDTNIATYLCLRKCKLNAKKANAKVTPMLARQVTARKAAGATVTTLNLAIRKKIHLLAIFSIVTRNKSCSRWRLINFFSFYLFLEIFLSLFFRSV